MAVIRLPSGKVVFKVKEFPGCCGIGIVHHVRFYIKISNRYIYDDFMRKRQYREQFKTLFTEFHNYLLDPGMLQNINLYALKRSCIIMTDNQQGPITALCTQNKWKKSKSFNNGNSGNTVTAYYLFRDN